MDCPYLTDIDFPPVLGAIGADAFNGCGNGADVPYTFEFSIVQGGVAGLESAAGGHGDYRFQNCDAELVIHWIGFGEYLTN